MAHKRLKTANSRFDNGLDPHSAWLDRHQHVAL